MKVDLRTVLAIIAEILLIIGRRIPISNAVSMVSRKHNLSESVIWDIRYRHGK